MCSYKLVEVSFDVLVIGSTIETHVQQVSPAPPRPPRLSLAKVSTNEVLYK